MISSETPYKLREIIQDTWPQLFRPGVNSKCADELGEMVSEEVKTNPRYSK